MCFLVLNSSNEGGCYMLADVGSTDKLGNIGPLDSRLPEWLAPTNILLQRGLDRDKLRPDILMTSSTPATPWGLSSSSPSRTSAPGAGTHPMGKHIWIVEVGYRAATRYHDKMTEKQQQHAQLLPFDSRMRPWVSFRSRVYAWHINSYLLCDYQEEHTFRLACWHVGLQPIRLTHSLNGLCRSRTMSLSSIEHAA